MLYDTAERSRLILRDSIYGFWKLYRQVVKPSSEPIYLCNSYPKSGTHLLSQILLNFPQVSYWNDIVSVQSLSGVMNTPTHVRWKIGSAPGGSLVRSHLMHDPVILGILRERPVKKIFMYRDLRDVAVSHANWVLKEPKIFLNPVYKMLPDFDACLSASIMGTPVGSPFGSNVSQPNIAQDFMRWKGWIDDPDTLAIKFEDLVGGRGGGDEAKRLGIVEKIARHIGSELSIDECMEKFTSDKMNPEESHTFRKGNKGAIGGWRTTFSEKHKDEFKRVAGTLLIELGYENDDSW